MCLFVCFLFGERLNQVVVPADPLAGRRPVGGLGPSATVGGLGPPRKASLRARLGGLLGVEVLYRVGLVEHVSFYVLYVWLLVIVVQCLSVSLFRLRFMFIVSLVSYPIHLYVVFVIMCPYLVVFAGLVEDALVEAEGL